MLRLRCYSLGLLFISTGWAADPVGKTQKAQESNGFPPGMVAMFSGASCPEGWTDEPLTQGRIPIGAATPEEGGEVTGEPFVDNRTTPHQHNYLITTALPDTPMNVHVRYTVNFVVPQTIEMAGATIERDANLPFYALPMCRRSVQP